MVPRSQGLRDGRIDLVGRGATSELEESPVAPIREPRDRDVSVDTTLSGPVQFAVLLNRAEHTKIEFERRRQRRLAFDAEREPDARLIH